jgi:hypothetical protein
MQMRGRHVLGIVVVVLGLLSVLATERYAARYQTLPVLDWLESRPPLMESSDVPPATELARGLVRTVPLMSIQHDARPVLPILGPPASVQRSISGVRDAAIIELGLPGAEPGSSPVRAQLEVIVFNRSVRAAAWADLMTRVLDVRDTSTGAGHVRVAGGGAADGVWTVPPSAGGGAATVMGHRGPVWFQLRVLGEVADTTRPEALLDLSARAELIAREAAADWAGWLEAHLTAA